MKKITVLISDLYKEIIGKGFHTLIWRGNHCGVVLTPFVTVTIGKDEKGNDALYIWCTPETEDYHYPYEIISLKSLSKVPKEQEGKSGNETTYEVDIQVVQQSRITRLNSFIKEVVKRASEIKGNYNPVVWEENVAVVS